MIDPRWLPELGVLVYAKVCCQQPHDGQKFATAAEFPSMAIPAAVPACVAQHVHPNPEYRPQEMARGPYLLEQGFGDIRA
jgi:hypothetical protein